MTAQRKSSRQKRCPICKHAVHGLVCDTKLCYCGEPEPSRQKPTPKADHKESLARTLRVLRELEPETELGRAVKAWRDKCGPVARGNVIAEVRAKAESLARFAGSSYAAPARSFFLRQDIAALNAARRLLRAAEQPGRAKGKR